MLLDVCWGMRSTWKALFVLAEAPGKAVSRKEIHALTGMGNKMIDKSLLILEKFKVITITRIGKRKYYKLNMNNPFTNDLLRLVSLEKERAESLGFEMVNILREIVYGITNINLENITKIILFGSYAKRIHREKSDIDLAVVVKERRPKEELSVTNLVDGLEKRFKKEIQIHYFTEKEFEKKSRLAEEIKKDGVVLVP